MTYLHLDANPRFEYGQKKWDEVTFPSIEVYTRIKELQWGKVNGYLRDTCLTAQDNYKALLDYSNIKYRQG